MGKLERPIVRCGIGLLLSLQLEVIVMEKGELNEAD